MHPSKHRTGLALTFVTLGLVLLIGLALAGTTWAAPGAQGTVPTPPKPTGQPTSTGGGGGDNGGNNGGDNGGDNNAANNGGDNGANQDSGGGSSQPAPAPAAGTGAVCAVGDNGAQCTAPDLTVVVSAGSAASGSALTIEGSFPQPPCPVSPTGHTFLNRCYRFSWIGTDTQPLTTLQAPVQYCIAFGAEQVAAVNNKPESLLVGLASANGSWTLLKPTIDAERGHACGTSREMATWAALFAPQAGSPVLPTVGADQSSVGLGLLGAFAAGLLLVGWRLRRSAV